MDRIADAISGKRMRLQPIDRSAIREICGVSF
jgi:hypothetical protein